MSNPARAPKELTINQLSLSVAPDSYLPEGYAEFAGRHKKVEEVQRLLGRLDMDLARTIEVPKTSSVAAAVVNKKGPALATAKVGVPVPRVRSAVAKGLVNRAYGALPVTGAFAQDVVAQAMRNKVYVDAGTEGALGRLAQAYPKVGEVPARPITRDEARAAVARCGLYMGDMPAPGLRPYPLTPVEGQEGVTVNPNSDNGFPVLGKWNTPGAAMMAMGMALSVRAELERAPDVVRWLREAEDARPWLVAVRGKAKADYYAPEKVVEGRMRFYNAFPRQMMLNMQVATQVLEKNAEHIRPGGASHSGIGLTLVRGGAADLVEALEEQLAAKGYAYVHVGDDSWVIVRTERGLCMFALDCSNFDLTQHAKVTEAVHAEIRTELQRVDRVAADLWYGYARERLVVVSGSVVRRFKHAGPSGMPLQSKVNDVLMDVMINRTLETLTSKTEQDVAETVESVGRAMGFSVKLEQFWEGNAETVVEALERRPFLFIGYYFHVRGGQVRVCCDVPRTFAQLPFPALKWVATPGELQVTEAMRLGSIALNLGMPTVELEDAFREFREGAAELIEDTIRKFGNRDDARLRWAVQENPFAESVQPSLEGLLRAVRRDPALLWMAKEVELPSTTAFVSLDWADQVEEEERAEDARQGVDRSRPATVPGVKRVLLPVGRVPTHPVTTRNDGRPPPTAVWGPDKARQERRETLGGHVRMKRSQRRRDLRILEEEVYSSDEEDYYE